MMGQRVPLLVTRIESFRLAFLVEAVAEIAEEAPQARENAVDLGSILGLENTPEHGRLLTLVGGKDRWLVRVGERLDFREVDRRALHTLPLFLRGLCAECIAGVVRSEEEEQLTFLLDVERLEQP